MLALLLTRGARQAMHARRYRPLSALALKNVPPTASAGAATNAYSMAPVSSFRLGRPFSVLLPSPLRVVTYAETSSPRDLSARVCFLSSQGRPRPHRHGGSGPRRHGKKGGSRDLKRGHARVTQRAGRTLGQLVRDNNSEEAWRKFYDLMESGEINVKDCTMMLKACHGAAQMRELIDVTMAKAKLKPNVVTYNTLVGTLRMEGDDAAAESVVEEMKKAGVEPDGRTLEILNFPSRGEILSRKRNSVLSQFLKQGGDEATVAARSMMDKMVEHGVANLHLFTLMLKFCKSSGEMREVIDVVMAKAKLKPDVVTYTTLVGTLRMEGDDAAAESVVEEMKKAGVEPNERTLEILNLPSRGEILSRKRNSVLSQFLKQGGDEATVAAWSMMAKMVNHGVADLHLSNLMLKFCKSSGEMRKVIEFMMAKAKLKPNVVTYTTLVTRLRMEGDDAAAESVVEEMKKAGVEPNERTLETLNLPSRGEELSRKRNSVLSQFLKQGGDEATVAAWSMMAKMVNHGVADLHLFTLMLKFCKSSGEMREVIDVTMAKAKLKPDVVMYNTLVGTLRMEGDDVAAESVVEEMKKAGVEPDERTLETLNLPSRGEDLSKMRNSKLSQFLKQGGDEATVAARSMMDKMNGAWTIQPVMTQRAGRTLGQLVRGNNSKEAWRKCYDLMESGEINVKHIMMLKACPSTAQMRELIDVTMAKAKLKPDVVMYTTLVGWLRMEGDDAAAESVVEEMKKAGVEPNVYTQEMLNYPSRGKYLSKMRTSKLSQILKQGGDEATVAARSMMDKMVEHGVADLHLFNFMLKACHSTAQMRELIDVTMAKAKLKPDVVTYTTLVGWLRMEGDDAAAESVVEEMKKAGVEPDERTLETLNLPSRGEDLSIMRKNKLSQFFKQGGDEATVAAWSMMAKMVNHGVADLHLSNLMLKFCMSSGEMREVIEFMMAKAKLKPDVVTYNTLVGSLRMEGDDAAAESVVEEMKKAGVEPDERTLETLNLPSRGEDLSKMRTNKLSQFLKQGGDEATVAAWSMMAKMVNHGVADLHLSNLMLKFCMSSGEMREVIEFMMAKAKLKPNVVTYTTLVTRLRMEGDDAAAESVVEEMKKAGVEPNERTLETLNLPSRGEDLSIMRKNKLSQFFKQGGDEATVAARSMMDKMVNHGVADLHLFTLMLKFCKSSGEMREVIDVMMAKAKLKPDVVTYNTLVGTLRIEGDDAATESVVEEMKKAGVEPDERTLETLNLPSRGEDLSKMRNSKLSQFLKQGGDEATVAARSMMDKMVEHGVANLSFFGRRIISRLRRGV